MNKEGYIRVKPGTSNLVLTMPHSATEIPEGIKHNLKIDRDSIKAFNFGIDLCVPFVTGFHEYDSAAKVWTTVPAAVLNVNRLINQVDKYAVEGGSEELQGHGMIWRASAEDSPEKIKPILKRPYTKEEFNNLLEEV